MAQAPKDLDLKTIEQRPYALLLDVAERIPDDLLSTNGTPRWPLAGITWVTWGCTNIDTDVVGCDKTNIKTLEDFAAIETQNPFLLVDGVRCSTLSSVPETMDARLETRLDIYASAAFAVELMRGTNGGPNSFRTNETTIISNTARTLRLAFVDLENFLAQKLFGARGVIHLTVGAMVLAAADQLVHFIDGQWRTATGHLVVADAGYTGAAPNGVGAPAADTAFLYASGPIYYAITATKPVGRRDHESTDMTRNVHQFFSERYGILAFDPCSVGAVRTTLA